MRRTLCNKPLYKYMYVSTCTISTKSITVGAGLIVQTVADHPTAGVQERQSKSNPKARLLLAANAGGSSSKAGPTPNNAEQMAQNGLKADIAEALNSKGGPTSKKNAGDRH